jgi:hypothetical protein
MTKAVAAIKAEIVRKQAEIDALKKALAALGGSAGGGAGRGNRKPRSEAQKRKISAALKKAWAERKKAAKKSAAAS